MGNVHQLAVREKQYQTTIVDNGQGFHFDFMSVRSQLRDFGQLASDP
jgi:hypothetical protein